MDTVLFRMGFAFYSFAMGLYVGYSFTKRESLAVWGRLGLAAGLTAHLLSFAARALEAGHHTGPWVDWFGSMSFFALVIVVEYLVVQWREHLPILGAFVTPLIFITMAAALVAPTGAARSPLPDEIQAHWLSLHVPLIFIAYGAFALAFAVGLAYLIQERQIKSKKPSHLAFRLPSLDELDTLIFRIVVFAVPVLLIGLLMGAAWAEKAWGRYWGWDSKETAALATFLIYTVYLHLRLVSGWRGRRTAYISLAGFAMVIFTYVGVNFFSHQHSFLSGGQ